MLYEHFIVWPEQDRSVIAKIRELIEKESRGAQKGHPLQGAPLSTLI